MFCSLVLAATVLTANAADRLLIVGEAVWGGWSIDNSIVMFNSTENPDVFKATVNLNANGTFKFLTTTEWGNLEYRAGDNDVTLSGVRLSAPAKGICVKRLGNKVMKTINKK